VSTEVTRCVPKYATPRSPDRATLGGEALGLTPLPWQQDALDLGLELLPGGTLAYKEVIITCGRQSGKSWVALAVALHRLIVWRHPPQVVAWSAQSGRHARKKLLDTFLPRLQASPLGVAVKETRRSQGGEALVFPRGSRLDVIASREASGHGESVDLAILDELAFDTDERRVQALMPALMTRPSWQLWMISTQGNEASTLLQRKVRQGRQAVLDGLNQGTAYIEYSADPEADHRDPATWYSCMPALGLTVDEEDVAQALASMEPSEFRRAYCNVQSQGFGGEQMISDDLWESLHVGGRSA
jgi:phage terminase large subunit-like protein